MLDPLGTRDQIDDSIDHIDERWLVSYSDMMTLLFGFFVMLYSTSSSELDAKSAEMARASIRENFGAAVPSEAVTVARGTEDLFGGSATSSANGWTPGASATPSRNQDGNLVVKPGKREGSAPAFEIPLDGNAPRAEITEITSNTDDDDDKADDNKELLAAEARAKRAEGKVAKLLAEATQLKADSAKTGALIADRDAKIASIESRLSALQAEAESLTKRAAGNGADKHSFLSVSIQWETEKHDVDLIVVHPSGKKFSFRNRTFAGMTGNLILDSRQGPGMEVWQDPTLTEGHYEFHAVLYNNYGNKKPAIVKGSVLTVKGRWNLPEVQLTDEKREAVYPVDVDIEGDVKIGAPL